MNGLAQLWRQWQTHQRVIFVAFLLCIPLAAWEVYLMRHSKLALEAAIGIGAASNAIYFLVARYRKR
jgi:hypothetical protein